MVTALLKPASTRLRLAQICLGLVFLGLGPGRSLTAPFSKGPDDEVILLDVDLS